MGVSKVGRSQVWLDQIAWARWLFYFKVGGKGVECSLI